MRTQEDTVQKKKTTILQHTKNIAIHPQHPHILTLAHNRPTHPIAILQQTDKVKLTQWNLVNRAVR